MHADPKPGSEDALVGVRVDNDKLMDLNAYLVSLPAPAGANGDSEAVGRGRDAFRSANCTQSKFVSPSVVPMKTIFPGDNWKHLRRSGRIGAKSFSRRRPV